MTGIVVVSHSRALAQAAVELATQMAPAARDLIEVAAGLDDGALGTDATAVSAAIERAGEHGEVVVMMDLGSAVLSAEMALDFIDDALRERVTLCAAPFVEGLVAAAVTAAGGAGGAEVAGEASGAIAMKSQQLQAAAPAPQPPTPAPDAAGPGGTEQAPGAVAGTAAPGAGALEAGPSGPDVRQASFDLSNPQGLHARPAALLVAEVKKFDAQVELRDVTRDTAWISAASIVQVMGMGAETGHHIDIRASGPQASQALAALVELAAQGFGE